MSYNKQKRLTIRINVNNCCTVKLIFAFWKKMLLKEKLSFLSHKFENDLKKKQFFIFKSCLTFSRNMLGEYLKVIFLKIFLSMSFYIYTMLWLLKRKYIRFIIIIIFFVEQAKFLFYPIAVSRVPLSDTQVWKSGSNIHFAFFSKKILYICIKICKNSFNFLAEQLIAQKKFSSYSYYLRIILQLTIHLKNSKFFFKSCFLELMVFYFELIKEKYNVFTISALFSNLNTCDRPYYHSRVWQRFQFLRDADTDVWDPRPCRTYVLAAWAQK